MEILRTNSPSTTSALPLLRNPVAVKVNTVTANIKARVKRAVSDPSKLIPDSIGAESPDQKAVMMDSAWADGLRGIASIFVVASHIVLCIARSIVPPCCGPDTPGSPSLFQLPILRLPAQGHSWVAIFFILLGFVNALKPIKLARARQVEAALSNLAVSSFRRTFRLVLPATAATVMSWFICQLGLYEVARNGDAFWLYTYTPWRSSSWGTAIEDLVAGLRATWALQSVNQYDQPQWALVYLLMGSFFVFAGLLATVNLAPAWRAACFAGFAAWSVDWSYRALDPNVGFTVFLGVALAELSLSDYPRRLARYSPLITPPLALAGLVMMSYPSSFAERAGWSNAMLRFAATHFPVAFQTELARSWGSLGGVALVAAILVSPHARRLLARRPLVWLGRVSFPIYLLHGTVLRTVFAWILLTGEPVAVEVDGQGGQKVTVQRYPQGGLFRQVLAVVVSSVIILVAAEAWTRKVEPVFGRITRRFEEIMTSGGEAVATPVSAAKSPGIAGGRPMLPVKQG